MQSKNYLMVLLLSFFMPYVIAQEVLKSGIKLSNVDQSIRPQDDFYRMLTVPGWIRLKFLQINLRTVLLFC